MKTKIWLLGIFALVTLATAAPHSWVLKTGETVAGDYVSSGTTALVIKTGGTNCIIKISDLSTNDQAFIPQIKADQKQARLDAEVKQMQQAGWIEFTSDLIVNFPEKVRDQIPGDGTIIHKYGWMDMNEGELEEAFARDWNYRPHFYKGNTLAKHARKIGLQFALRPGRPEKPNLLPPG